MPSEWLQERIKDIGADSGAVEKYFASQLLPFKTIRDVRRYERAFKVKASGQGRGILRVVIKASFGEGLNCLRKTLDRLQLGRLR